MVARAGIRVVPNRVSFRVRTTPGELVAENKHAERVRVVTFRDVNVVRAIANNCGTATKVYLLIAFKRKLELVLDT